MKKIAWFICFVTIACVAHSQENADALNVREDIERQSLDAATVRVYYHFTQKEKAEDKTAFRNDTMTLDIGAQMSYYYDETKAKKDSLFSSVWTNLNPASIKSISVIKDSSGNELDNFMGEKYEQNYYDGTSEKIYKNRFNGQLTILDYSNDAYKCEDPVGSFRWEITLDTALIFNYLCQKANVNFRGRNYEVWFTPEIPINDGPWKFFGLPGLILQVNDSKK
jgi:GLPGLI family protein